MHERVKGGRFNDATVIEGGTNHGLANEEAAHRHDENSYDRMMQKSEVLDEKQYDDEMPRVDPYSAQRASETPMKTARFSKKFKHKDKHE